MEQLVMNEDNSIEWFTVAFYVHETIFRLNSTIASLHKGEFDESGSLALEVDLGDALFHLCLAWNSRIVDFIERGERSQEEYERSGYSIPLLDERIQLMTGWDFDSCLNEGANDVSRETLDFFLRRAKQGLDDLENAVDHSAANVQLLTATLAGALKNMCLAWHLRFVPKADIASISKADVESISCSIPLWNSGFRLVEIT